MSRSAPRFQSTRTAGSVNVSVVGLATELPERQGASNWPLVGSGSPGTGDHQAEVSWRPRFWYRIDGVIDKASLAAHLRATRATTVLFQFALSSMVLAVCQSMRST